MRSTRIHTLQRRLIAIPLFLLAFALVWPLLPLGFLVAFVVDLLKTRRWIYVRCTVVVAVYLGLEVVGMLASLILWPSKLNQKWFVRSHFAFQRWWLGTLYRVIHGLFELKTTVTGTEVFKTDHPALIFVRHLSLMDMFLPAYTISQPYGILLKYVLKKELQWSPSFDFVGNRLTNYFVDRRSMAGRREIENVAKLAKNLGPKEGVLIYPEGTRFSAQKRERLLTIMKRREKELFVRAKALDHLMPPHLGGVLALLNTNPQADVVFMAHTGLEGIRDIKDLLSGDLIGRHVRIHLWRVARAEISKDESGQTTWMYDQWEQMNQWVEAHLPTQ